jgi:hypothetical protein
MRIVVGVGDLVQKTVDGQAQVGYSVVRRSRGWVTLCAVCTMHKEMRSASFLVWPQNQGQRFLLVWPQNRWLQVSRFGPQNRQLWFSDLDLKITAMVSWCVHQNQAGYGLSVVPQNRREDEDGIGHALRASGLLCLEASQTRVSQFGLKTSGGVALMVHMASSRRSRGDEVVDERVDAMGCIRTCYPYFVVFTVLGTMGISIF